MDLEVIGSYQRSNQEKFHIFMMLLCFECRNTRASIHQNFSLSCGPKATIYIVILQYVEEMGTGYGYGT
jgi:hypothetical protein